tara:strand:+ start:2936 stop:3322 length:387 start_codon:yes stop_codon:yes gene_type:complete
MVNVNKLVLIGRLTRQPELRFTEGGTAVCKAGCVINERSKRGDQWVEEPVFFEATLFGKRAEAFANYHSKGSEFCFASARLAFDSWEDKTTGEKRSKLYVIANEWEFMTSKAPSAEPTATYSDTPTPF